MAHAREVLAEAWRRASGPDPLPAEWLEWTRRIDECPNRTFTVALGTALLARASDPRIDALALKATTGPTAYSARGVAHTVLAPFAAEHGFSIRATGREPLNNQPFFRYDRIDEIDRVHPAARPYLPDLVQACQRINRLPEGEAKAALAAFVRVRIEATKLGTSLARALTPIDVTALLTTATTFVTEDPEGGRRGQAFVAAAFDLAFEDVRTGRINDPSRRLPGDVQAMDGATVLVAAEVRQKIVSERDVLSFAATLHEHDVEHGLVVALHPLQQPLPREALVGEAEERYNVLIQLAEGPAELLLAAMLWAGRPLTVLLQEFPQRMLMRLTRIEVSAAGQRRWADLFRQPDPD